MLPLYCVKYFYTGKENNKGDYPKDIHYIATFQKIGEKFYTIYRHTFTPEVLKDSYVEHLLMDNFNEYPDRHIATLKNIFVQNGRPLHVGGIYLTAKDQESLNYLLRGETPYFIEICKSYIICEKLIFDAYYYPEIFTKPAIILKEYSEILPKKIYVKLFGNHLYNSNIKEICDFFRKPIFSKFNWVGLRIKGVTNKLFDICKKFYNVSDICYYNLTH